jgi:nucleoside phosphorylase
MDSKRTVIFTAMRQEARAIARALGLKRLEEGLYSAGAGGEVVLVTIGIGAKRLPRLLCAGASRVIVAGLAGGLDPSLRTGDVVVDPCPSSLDGLRQGTVHTSARLVCTTADKAALFGSTGSACVDMETELVRAAAESGGAPFVAVRAIMDTAHEALSPELLALTDSDGRVRPLAVLRLLLRRPGSLKELMRLRRSSKIALRALGDAVRAVVSHNESMTIMAGK